MRKIVGIVVGGALMAAATGCGEAEANPGDPIVLARADLKGGGGQHDAVHAHCPANMPAGLNPPADQTIAAAFPARGVQIYVCQAPAAGGAPAWTLKAPHAVLFEGNDPAVIHFAGPSWQALDGSLVTATKTAGATPDPAAIPWLLLQVASHTGAGLLADTTFIQRLKTTGGNAPATGCDADHLNAQVLVPYTADYFFYHPAPADAKKLHRCKAP